MEPRLLLASLAMATGFSAYPFAVSQAAIVPKDGAAMTPTGNVFSINREGGTDKFAYRRFQEFGLEKGYIANFNFGNADAFASLVKSKITVDGIVNAVKGGAIDGHLIFLSPNGIAVGSSGIINAGQFTGIVPAQADFDKLYNSSSPDTEITLAAIQALGNGAFADGKSIVVNGRINTHSGVMLGAGIIDIKDGSRIQSTKNLDFKDLVNIGGGASANLGSLKAVAGTGGDIILTARRSSVAKDTKPVLKADGTYATINKETGELTDPTATPSPTPGETTTVTPTTAPKDTPTNTPTTAPEPTKGSGEGGEGSGGSGEGGSGEGGSGSEGGSGEGGSGGENV